MAGEMEMMLKVEAAEKARERILGCGNNNADNKVLPLNEEATIMLCNSIANDDDDDENDMNGMKAEKKKEIKVKIKIKAMERLKEMILRSWAASKSKKFGGKKLIALKVLYFRNRERSLKAIVDVDDEQLNINYESPKISFKWELESCNSTISSANSFAPTPSKFGHWITTDSDFVVLEL